MKTTYQKLRKSKVPCLYIHDSGQYYARKKIKGKIYVEALATQDYQIAKNKLAVWMREKEAEVTGTATEADTEKVTLCALCVRFMEHKAGKKEGTRKIYQWVINRLAKDCPFYLLPIAKVNPLDYTSYVGTLKLKPRGTNEFLEIFTGILTRGVVGGYLPVNPIKKLKDDEVITNEPIVREDPDTPTEEQAEKIINAIVNKHDKNGPKSSSDFLRFLYLAGIGEAELRALKWSDVDFKAERIYLRRVKTGKPFYVPFYAWLKPFLVELHDKRKEKTGRIFDILTIKQSITNTCKKLGYKHYSPRNFRQACIVRLIRAKVDIQLIAKYQGHTDGGKLILGRYSQVKSDADSNYEKEQLAQLAPKQPEPAKA